MLIRQNLSENEVLQLNAMSKGLYGSTSYWSNKLVKRGIRKSNKEIESDPTGATVKYLKSYEDVRAYMQMVSDFRAEIMKNTKEAPIVNDQK